MNEDRVTEVYEGTAGSREHRRVLRQRIHWMCAQAKGSDVLDIGCSQGIASILLAREGKSVLGVDSEIGVIEFARARLLDEEEATRRRARFVIGEAASLDLDEDSFDTVLMGELLEHQVDPRPAVDEALRVLRPEGRLVATTPYGVHAYHDHKEPLYLAGLLDLLEPRFAIEDIELIGRYLGLVAAPSSGRRRSKGSISRRALDVAERRLAEQDEIVAEQRQKIVAIRDDAKKLYGYREEASRAKLLEERLTGHEEVKEQLERELGRSNERVASLEAELARSAERVATLEREVGRWSERAATLQERDRNWQERDQRQKNRIAQLEERLAHRAEQLSQLYASRWYRIARRFWSTKRGLLHPFRREPEPPALESSTGSLNGGGEAGAGPVAVLPEGSEAERSPRV